MTSEKSSFELHLEKLKGEYKTQLPTKLETIASDWLLLTQHWQTDVMVRLHRNVHSLIGTSGTFGFTDLSKIARILEEHLKPLLEEENENYKPDANMVSSINTIIKTLINLIKITHDDQHP